MKKGIFIVSFSTLGLGLLFIILNHLFSNSLFFALAIVFCTIAYHFIIRLIVGYTVDFIMKNKADYNKRWYRTSKRELAFYKKINVKEWKNKLPSYNKSLFDTSIHTWNEVIQAMCQAEVVHEVNMIMSLLPIFVSFFVGNWIVFIVTSILACLFDYLFVMVQRFNRNRIIHSLTYSRERGE